MIEHAFHWPPKRPPTDREILASWHVLHVNTVAFLKRHIEKSEVRAFLKTLEPRMLCVNLIHETEHQQEVMSDVGGESDDARPSFSESDVVADWNESDEDDDLTEEGPGGAPTLGVDCPVSAETRFCISMEYSARELNLDHKHFAISDYLYRRVALHPDAAVGLISGLKGGVKAKKKKTVKEYRRIIADALVFGFIERTVQDSVAEELEDGGVEPTWRTRETDPALDVLTMCPHLRQLYMQICGFEDDVD